MARKLSFVLALAVMAAVALLLNLSSTPQIGVAGVAPDKPHNPGDEVFGGVINTNEDVKVEIPLSANHNDGTIGCTELTFDTSDDTNGSVGAITDRDCNTTELARDLTDAEFYDPAASENGGDPGTCSDGIDNDTDDPPDGLIDADDPDCLFGDVIPLLSIGGLNKGVQGVIQIGDELITFDSADPAGDSACEGDGADKDSSPPCLTTIGRGAFKTTADTHSTGDTVIFRSELGDAKIEDNLDGGITADSPDKSENLDILDDTGFPAEGVVMVDDELIIYRGPAASDQLQDVIRGALGSTAATHSDDAHVFLIEPGFYGTLVEEIDSVQSILRITTLTGYGLNGGIVEVENEVIIYDQTGSTNAECEGASPCLLGLTRSAFGTTSKLHEVGRTVFTAAGDDIDQATVNFTPRNEFNNDQKILATLVRDPDGDLDDTSTTIPVGIADDISAFTALGFDESGGILTIQAASDEVVTYDDIGTTSTDCAPFDPPCFAGVTRARAQTTAQDLADGQVVIQVATASPPPPAGAGFLYTVGKDDMSSPEVLVKILVAEVNDPPEFKAGAKMDVSLAQGGFEADGSKQTNPQTSFVVIANDIDNCDLEFTFVSVPSSGSLFEIVDDDDKFLLSEDDSATIDCGDTDDGRVGVLDDPFTDKDPNTFSFKLIYVQDSTYDGSDSFIVEVTDNKSGDPGDKDAKGLDTLTVNLTNSAPTAGPIDKVEVPTDGARTILLTGSDADPGHCELNFIVKTHPTHGNLVLQNNNECRPGGPNTDSSTMVYEPDAGYSGPDSFTYQVYDRTGKGLYDPNLGDGHNRTSLEVQINVSPTVPPEKDLVFGDVDCDGDVDGVDALKIQRWIIDLSVTQEPGCLEIGSDY